jgi:hypothetical protein
MTIDQAKEILRANGKPTCPCKYENSVQKMLETALKIQENNNLLK